MTLNDKKNILAVCLGHKFSLAPQEMAAFLQALQSLSAEVEQAEKPMDEVVPQEVKAPAKEGGGPSRAKGKT